MTGYPSAPPALALTLAGLLLGAAAILLARRLRRSLREREEAREGLRASEERFRRILVSLPEGMHFYRLEAGDRLVFTGSNPAASVILGVDHAPFVGRTIEEAFPPLAQTEIPGNYRKVAREGGLWSTEQVDYRDSAIAGAFAVTAFQPAPGEVAAIFRDITAGKRLQAELADYRRRLEEGLRRRTEELAGARMELAAREQLAVLGHFTAVVAHDLRNPLATVTNSLFSLRASWEKGDRAKGTASLEMAERNLSRVNEILERLLDLTRRHRNPRQELFLDRWAGEVLDEQVIPPGAVLVRDLASGATVAADPEELRRALANVLTNAFQSLGEAGATGKRVLVSTRAEGGEARVTVTDSGPGFSPEAREHIFQLLYTSKSGGVGLGMSIVRDTLRSLGGQVTIGDAPGGGAVVTLTLPLAPGKGAAG